jgi:hypothetical protein
MSILEQPISKFGKLGNPGGLVAMGAAFVALIGTTGCISDTDCGVCDPDKLVLESISGINYSNRKVHHLSEGVSQGKYFIEDISACEETEDATDPTKAPRGAEEWCKLSPLVTWQGLEFVFNNLLDPTSIELVRKDPSNPQLFEIYDWKTQLAHIEGPVTRFNGDYVPATGDEPDIMARAVNLTCIDNLNAQGIAFDHAALDANPDICNDFYTADGRMVPLKMQAAGRIESYRGQSDWRAASCTAPDSGPDTCCTVCDYELSVNVEKYGVDSGGARRTPENALTCSPSGNVYEDCADFVVDINRDAELNRYTYEWNGMIDTFRLPLSDKIRETHPDDRPMGVEPDGVPCQTDADCSERLGSEPGAVCIGTTPAGVACDAETEDCGSKHCKAEWFVGCNDNSLCVDRRFKDKGAGACFETTDEFVSCEPAPVTNCAEGMGIATGWGPGNRLARCDSGEFPDGNLDPGECCQQSLGAAADGTGCDPLFQSSVVPVDRFDRDRTLPEETRDCYCGDPSDQAPDCAAQVEQLCTAPFGNLERHDGTSNEGQYITRFITKQGGVIYDPALKGVLYLPADRGNQPRSLVESCADLAVNPPLISGRNVQDGWRMHDDAFFETYENFDRGMCSASEYRVVFATDGEQVVDKVGNTLPSDQTTYVFQTPEFHVVPGTGFPTDNLRVGACDDFEMSLSNKYDLDPENLRKIELWQISRNGLEMDKLGEDCSTSLQPECWSEEFVVAGGRNCTTDPELVSESTPPCLTIDVSLQREGNVRVQIDTVKFGIQLFNLEADADQNSDQFGRTLTGRYRMAVPGLEDVEHFDDLNLNEPADREAYDNAFHDVCGMPLITKGGQNYTDFYYDFTIDEPKCKEDEDSDDVQLSCDNAREHYNPVQEDQDIDGFGDVVDLCQLTESDSNTADSDKDGIGNDCDTCRQTVDKYNFDMAMVADPRMWVRNVPFQFDFDQDGIGDVCDNCVTTANCGVFDEANPHSVGVPVPFEEPGVCQTDANTDMIGDECFDPDTMMGMNDENAAGVIGFEMIDDFDQDGIINAEDWCTRQPVAQTYAERIECTADTDCPVNAVCAATPANSGVRYCNHADFDGDQVGDFCDTCPYKPNPMQVTEGGMQLDDDDEDFVGADCETNSSCHIRKDPRPYAFMEVSIEGSCCTTTYPGDGVYVQNEDGSWGCEGLCDPDGFPITRTCDNEAIPGEDLPDGSKCRLLPPVVASLPGVVDLPPGCDEALTAASLCAPSAANNFSCGDLAPNEINGRLTLSDVGGDDNLLWGKMCFLPQWDQDYDGVGDACDLCKFSYDPFNEPYVDDVTGKLWDNIGRFCAGIYAPDAVCAAAEPEGEDDTGTESGGTESGG